MLFSQSNKHKNTWFPSLWVVVFLLVGCGSDANFNGKQGSSEARPIAAEETPLPYDGLVWLWECEAQKTRSATPEDDAVIIGEGEHDIDGSRVNSTPITFRGRLCPPQDLPRDIVIAIDVSGSMRENDFPASGTCGRLEALKAVLTSAASSNARFGIVLFDTDVTSSSALYETATDLVSDIAPQGHPVLQICAMRGETNYTEALESAANLLKGGRPEATKEIYVISDGTPSLLSTGEVVADRLKTDGIATGQFATPVSIATVMLSGDDEILEQKIASKDQDGNPLHAFVSDANQLAETLNSFAATQIVSGTLKYRVIGERDWEEVNLDSYVEARDFSLPPIELNQSEAGIEVELSYIDSHGVTAERSGRLVLKKVGA